MEGRKVTDEKMAFSISWMENPVAATMPTRRKTGIRGGIMELIPQDLDSEHALLAICLTDGRQAMEDIELATDSNGLFYDERYREVWNRMERIRKSGKPINLISVGREKVEFDLEAGFLSKIDADGLPASFIPSYLPGAVEARKRRCSVNVGTMLAAQAKDKTVKIDQAIGEAEESLFRARFKTEGDKTIKDFITEGVNDWESAAANRGKLSGIASGFRDLDKLTWGFQPNNLVIIAARPSQGKTAILLNIAENACVLNHVPTLIFSLESTGKELAKRLMCSLSKQDSHKMRSGEQDDLTSITVASSRINKSPLHIIDRGTITIDQMRSLSRRYQSKYGIKMILVDYLQKIRATTRNEKRTYEVAQVSEGLKEIAKELHVPVIAACQLNRESVKEKPRAPRPSDLGDSGMIERDADLIACLHRPTDDQPQSGNFVRFNLLLMKHRDGPCGKVKLLYRRECTRFESMTEEKNYQPPHNND